MPRPTRTTHHIEYAALRAASNSVNERADCAVVAVSAATGASYVTVRELMTKLGRKNRRGTAQDITAGALRALGFMTRAVNGADKIKQYPGQHTLIRHVTTHHPDRFPRVWADGKTYLFRTNGHILCVKDGRNMDWTRGSAKRVWSIQEVVPLGTPAEYSPRFYDDVLQIARPTLAPGVIEWVDFCTIKAATEVDDALRLVKTGRWEGEARRFRILRCRRDVMIETA